MPKTETARCPLDYCGIEHPCESGTGGAHASSNAPGVLAQAEASFDAGTQRYTYLLSVNNPSTNTGEISDLSIDVTTLIPKAFVPAFDSSGLTVPVGGDLIPFDEKLAKLQPLSLPAGTNVVPFDQSVPAGWDGGLGVDGQAAFSSRTGTPNIAPGTSLGGFELISRGMPTIRKMQVVPFWVFLVDNVEAVAPEQEAQAREVEKAIIFHTFSLGTSAHTPGTFAHWDQVRDDLNQAIQLGWVPDHTLATALVTQLASARQALDATDGTLAKTRLQTLIQTVTQSTPAQRRREIFDLMFLNTQRLAQNLPSVGFLAKSSTVEDKLNCPPGVRCAEVTAEGANLRESPGVGGRVLSRLPKGAIVSTFEIQGDWVQIERCEEPTGKVVSGWLHRSLVKQVQCFED